MMASKLSAVAHIPHRKTQKMVVANRKIGLEVSTEETKYMVMSLEQHAGQNNYIYVGNESFKSVQ